MVKLSKGIEIEEGLVHYIRRTSSAHMTLHVNNKKMDNFDVYFVTALSDSNVYATHYYECSSFADIHEFCEVLGNFWDKKNLYIFTFLYDKHYHTLWYHINPDIDEVSWNHTRDLIYNNMQSYINEIDECKHRTLKEFLDGFVETKLRYFPIVDVNTDVNTTV